MRQNFTAGKVDEVSKLLRQHLPHLIEAEGGDSKPDLIVYFHVNVMKFIELIRQAPPLPLACMLIYPGLSLEGFLPATPVLQITVHAELYVSTLELQSYSFMTMRDAHCSIKLKFPLAWSVGDPPQLQFNSYRPGHQSYQKHSLADLSQALHASRQTLK